MKEEKGSYSEQRGVEKEQIEKEEARVRKFITRKIKEFVTKTAPFYPR